MSMVTEPSPGVGITEGKAHKKNRAPTVVAAIVAAALVGLGIWWLAGSGSDSESTEPGTAFSWDGDDISEWVTEEEMTAALQQVSTRYAGADLEDEAVLEHDEGTDVWSWSTGPVDVDMRNWVVSVDNGDHNQCAPPTRTDPRLPQGVTYGQTDPFWIGCYTLSGPNSDESISITLQAPGMARGFPELYTTELGVHRDMAFALASMMLREMGWVT